MQQKLFTFSTDKGKQTVI